jgi:hypothetical protein
VAVGIGPRDSARLDTQTARRLRIMLAALVAAYGLGVGGLAMGLAALAVSVGSPGHIQRGGLALMVLFTALVSAVGGLVGRPTYLRLRRGIDRWS